MPTDLTTPATQMDRVLAVMRDGRERTLRQIESECRDRFGHADTQPAISARLREAHLHGYDKSARMERQHSKHVWFYKLSPLKDDKA